MPRAAPAITRFNAGKLSPLISARIDQQMRPYYDAGAQVLTNWMPLVEGPITKRPGFKFVKAARSTAVNVHLVPFEESLEESFMLEFSNSGAGDRYVRFYKDGAAVLETAETITGFATAFNPVGIQMTGHPFATGDEVFIEGSPMAEINNRYFTVTYFDANEFRLDNENGLGRSTGTGGTASKVYEINGLLAEDISTTQTAQRKNELFIVNSEAPVSKITRNADTDWTIASYNNLPDWPPFEYDSTSGVTIQASAATGSITLTASSAIFVTSDVTRRFRLTGTTLGIGPYVNSGPGGEGFAVITALGGASPSTTATATVQAELDPEVVSSPTTRWARDAWGDVNGFPSAIGFFDDRLWVSGVIGLPGQVWASRIGSYGDFSRLTDDSGGLHFEIQQSYGNQVQWIKGMDATLIIGTERDEHTITSFDGSSAIAAGNIQARRRSSYGSHAGVEPIAIDDRVVYAQRVGRRVRNFRYRIESNEVDSFDLTRLSREMAEDIVSQMSYQQEPNRLVWTMMEDGSIAALTFDSNESVVAWSDIALGGSPLVVSEASLPSQSSSSDELWAATTRTIDGNTDIYIELLQPFWERGNSLEDAWFLDCAILYDGSPATAFVGADHLEGETVACFADGVQVDDVTITAGAFTIAEAASKVLIGYEYTCQYLSMPIEAGSADGTSQGKPGSIARIALRLDQTGDGLSYGVTLADLRDVPLSEVPLSDVAPASGLLDGDVDELTMPMNQGRRRTIALQHTGALPCTVVGVFPRLEAR